MSRTMAPTKPSRPPKSSSCTTCSTLRGRPVHGACHACSRARRPITAAASGVMAAQPRRAQRSEEHTSELQSRLHLVCRLLLEKKKTNQNKPRLDEAHDHQS